MAFTMSEITEETFGDAVDERLGEVAGEFPFDDSRPVSVRRRLNAYRAVLRGFMRLIARRHEERGGGIAVARLITELIDRFALHACGSYAGCGGRGPAFIALGGYGRRELNPFSDIDILCLVRGDEAGVHDTGISDMLKFLWDMNMDLGHSTRTVENCIETAGTDPSFATSLLDARFLAGDESVWKMFGERLAEWMSGKNGRKLLLGKVEERKKRLAYYHDTVQIQEPNVKECPGALRDIHVSRWLMKLTGRGGDFGDFSEAGFLTEREARAFGEDLDFLLSLRHTLHFLNGKRSDTLDRLVLPEAAARMGYEGAGTRPVEKLMHDYYMRAARVRRLTDRVIRGILDELNPAGPRRYTRTASGVLVGERDVRLAQGKTAALDESPGLVVTVFAEAGARGLPISGDTAAAVEEFLETCTVDFPAHPGVRAAFHALMNMKKGVGGALRLMHEHGVLTRIIPEFDAISWHYQYDFYHTYTTDEHSIRVVENLERMSNDGETGIRYLSEIMVEVPARSALYLAGLLHDVGKPGGAGHARRGEIMAERALRRLGYDRRTIDLVGFLIREHLLMSHISQRRDMEDREILSDFIGRVGSTGRLRMLTLLTFADLMALSETALTDWKKALIRGLYTRALVLIEKGYEEHVPHSRRCNVDCLVKALEKHVPDHVVRAHLELLPEQYIRVTGRAAVRAHIRGIERMKKRGVWASFRRGDDITLLTVVTRDHPRALADICGTITSSGINILGARIFTRNDGIIIDTFLVTDADGSSRIPPETQREFKRNIEGVVSGRLEVRNLIESYLRRWRRRKKNVVFSPPRVRVHNDVSTRYTVIDVFATDYTGLLYDITSVLASFDIDIHTARIGTDEDQVADAFYVQGPDGGKIEDETEIKKLKRAIIDRLNSAHYP